jgi:hypothetical protein
MKIRIRLAALPVLSLAAIALAWAQQAPANRPLTVVTTSLPRAYSGVAYHLPLEATGGLAPYHWELVSGELPDGVRLDPKGELVGTPHATGDFHFAVAVFDSARPPNQRNQEFAFTVVAPLMAEWGRDPKVNGQRIEGSIKVSNSTDHDFDLTFIVVAVNDIGRATALGYQHFKLKKGVSGMELPFGENLPHGGYVVNVDVAGEVPETNSIYRARLVTPAPLPVP